MEGVAAVETRRPIRETPAQRFGRDLASFAKALLRTIALAAVLSPILLASFLTADLPVRFFDRLFDSPDMKPGQWLSVGGLAMMLVLPAAVLVTRRFGGDEASRATTAAWGTAAVVVFAGLSWLAPSIEPGDMPSVRFVVAFVASAMIGQYLAIAVYDITRGGGAWWRPPLLAAMIGFAAQSFIYFPSAYWTASAPWLLWLIFDLGVRFAVAFGFLPIYFVLQKALRPRGGFGG